ncbi:MAG: response regulator transcription factor [Bryobacteraceae bacterium]|nr:response regulator transcription factor [Bryobacteraceae bacterium]
MQLPSCPAEPKAILLTDDHPVIRKGLRVVVERELPGCAVAEADSGAQTRLWMRRRKWDLVVLDLNLPDCNGFDLLWEMKQNWDVKVLVFSMYPETPFGIRALRAGADGYVSKGSPEQELCAALHAVIGGHRHVSPSLAETLADWMSSGKGRFAHDELTDREFEVLVALAGGQGPTEIAAKMNVSPKTISTLRRRVLRKLGLTTNAELVRYALEHKLIV